MQLQWQGHGSAYVATEGLRKQICKLSAPQTRLGFESLKPMIPEQYDIMTGYEGRNGN